MKTKEKAKMAIIKDKYIKNNKSSTTDHFSMTNKVEFYNKTINTAVTYIHKKFSKCRNHSHENLKKTLFLNNSNKKL